MIGRFKHEYGLNNCCGILGVFKSSYYYHTHSGTLTIREQEVENEKLRQIVLDVIEVHAAYGYRRMIPELKKYGMIVNHKRLLPLLKTWGIGLKRHIVKKTRSGVESILAALGSKVNIVKRLSAEEKRMLGTVVYTDFSEIVYGNGLHKVYLFPYLEHLSKKILGYAVGKRPTTDVALAAFDKARATLKSWGVDITHTYFHSDQGSVFKSYAYVKMIVITVRAWISFSRVGTPQDNPEMESFFGRLKDEWRTVFYQAQTETEILRLISEAIEYYNMKRIHSNHKDKSPDEFLKELLQI